MRNNQVIQAFRRGEKAVSWTENLRSDGTTLWSYSKKIAHRTSAGVVVVGDFTAPGGDFSSVTTSGHVNRAKSVAHHVFHPRIFNDSEKFFEQGDNLTFI
jgi:hypothetical protein